MKHKGSQTEEIEVRGARVNNLKNVSVDIPRDALTVITGLSGSGKSSLAFNTIYAEGQRRYIETFSAYARNFLGSMERPDVDSITGLSPVISIEQKTVNKNPRSTVGTVTEIYDYLRLLFAKASTAYSYETGEKMVKFTEEQVVDMILKSYAGKKIYILAPLVKARKGHYKELLDQTRRKGFAYVRIDGKVEELKYGMRLDRYKIHDIEVVIDRFTVKDEQRLKQSVTVAMKAGDGLLMVLDAETMEVKYFSRKLMCPTTGIAYKDPAPHNFSFNSPQGACPKCKGLGYVNRVDVDKVIPDRSISIYNGGIVPLGRYKNLMIFWQIQSLLEKHGLDIKMPISELPDDVIDEIMHGSEDKIKMRSELIHSSSDYYVKFDGLAKYIQMQQDDDASATARKWAEQFSIVDVCPMCGGKRLKQEALAFRIEDKNIHDLSVMDIEDLLAWFEQLPGKLDERQLKIGGEIIKEISNRLGFLCDVGLDYLSLDRSSMTLSGGESQRIRLATQIGSQLVNVLYILDEPSIGLHQRDNEKLINSLKKLKDEGNTVIVVEHDREMMEKADYIIDMGPGAGRLGGKVVFAGTPKEIAGSDSLTAQYLNDVKEIAVPAQRRKGNGTFLKISGARGNNLKGIDVSFPLGCLICVTGVSGSGKSTLINSTLQPILSQAIYHSLKSPLGYDAVDGLKYVDKVISVDQSPIGRTPRSNPVTFTGVFTDIRSLFAELPEAKIRGYKGGRFSFNIAGGRCEECGGNGYKTIDMRFLPDVTVPCEACHGKRYNRETLEVKYNGKSIADVLDMTINMAVEFFENVPQIVGKLKVLQEVGLGYLKLGQSSTTLSGGESQRVKLAAELSKKETGKTIYILDEPTTGLHFEDIRILLTALNRLVDKGNTVIVIEHNLDVIKSADYLIDIGPEGGKNGGNVVFAGTPEEMVKSDAGYTAKYLKQELSHAKDQ
ncbi:MAG TPA: excinuclease ABC subunit UvrA [Candidatus Avibacteroides faecavium]|nr:excinuclease ABC subunit UvrA [Candidatus Avibacteroides faecavium]